MTTSPRRFPAAPFTAPVGGDIDQRLAQVAQAINRKADSTAEPTFAAILFTASDGSTWRLRISPAGATVIEQVTS